SSLTFTIRPSSGSIGLTTSPPASPVSARKRETRDGPVYNRVANETVRQPKQQRGPHSMSPSVPTPVRNRFVKLAALTSCVVVLFTSSALAGPAKLVQAYA